MEKYVGLTNLHGINRYQLIWIYNWNYLLFLLNIMSHGKFPMEGFMYFQCRSKFVVSLVKNNLRYTQSLAPRNLSRSCIHATTDAANPHQENIPGNVTSQNSQPITVTEITET